MPACLTICDGGSPVPFPLFLTPARAPLAAAEDTSGPGTSGLYVITAGTASLVQEGGSYTLTLGSVSPQTVWFEVGGEEMWTGEKRERRAGRGLRGLPTARRCSWRAEGRLLGCAPPGAAPHTACQPPAAATCCLAAGPARPGCGVLQDSFFPGVVPSVAI